MPNRTIRIDNLHLTVSGISRADARTLGEDVARHLAKNFPSSKAGSVDALHIRVSFPKSAIRSSLAQTIAENIARRIG